MKIVLLNLLTWAEILCFFPNVAFKIIIIIIVIISLFFLKQNL